jgi:hypothetical protein
VAFRSEDQVSSEMLKEAVHGYGWIVPVSLASLQPGTYLLRVEVKPRAKNVASTVREVPLDVRAPRAAGQ